MTHPLLGKTQKREGERGNNSRRQGGANWQPLLLLSNIYKRTWHACVTAPGRWVSKRTKAGKSCHGPEPQRGTCVSLLEIPASETFRSSRVADRRRGGGRGRGGYPHYVACTIFFFPLDTADSGIVHKTLPVSQVAEHVSGRFSPKSHDQTELGVLFHGINLQLVPAYLSRVGSRL